jgi:nucleoside-diphosphate-sugar epimerase
MTLGITGGTGFIGSHLVEFLLNRGHQVECLTRTGTAYGWLETNDLLNITKGNLLDPESMTGFINRNDIIIHLAALTRARNKDDFLSINLKGTQNLLNTIKKENPSIQQLIIMSSQAAVGPSTGESFLNEEAPLNPISPYGRSKASLEQYLKEECSDLPVTIIRPPSVYGPRDKDFIELFKIINKGFKPIVGKNNRISFVYVKNLVEGIYAAIHSPHALGETFFITDEGAYTWKEFGSFIEKGLDKKTLTIYVPKFAVKIAYVFSTLFSYFTNKPILLTKDKLEEMNNPFWMVSNEKAQRVLGYTPSISTQEGVSESIKWYLKNGWL